ncbi:SDR family NAD(P)-dependent oxidoreductase [Parvularcula marina]|uniref:SDR family oxidoreductase n=1 Tax=Parvularcula marina TaxID=2292771 RepID=A0A371RLB0_9PROT|nr:SDR family NAD(P)-dependent oxidoreductase [Parvularcula marina]RFB06249.1 SDR family oxidoreductase [Parvularcula marina]
MSEIKRVALVTGCGKRDGIGAAVARSLSSAGMNVVVTDIASTGVSDLHQPKRADDPDWRGVDSLVEELAGASGEASAVTGDVSDPAGVSSMVGHALDSFGRLDVLVNNAGAPFSMGHGDIEAIDPDEWDKVMAINLRGPFLMCRAAAPHMREKGFGRIVNVSSVAGRVGSKANAAYAASKAGVLALTQSLALDLGGQGITANSVLPGFILTSRSLSGMSKKLGQDDIDDETIARSTPQIPAGRAGTPEDVAGAVAFLASDAASYINGQSVIVDGGNVRL